MMIRGRRVLSVTLAMCLLLTAGCGVSGTVTDIRGHNTRVDHLALSRSEHLVVLDGETQRSIPLHRIRSLELVPRQSRTHAGQLYFGVRLWLKTDDEGDRGPSGTRMDSTFQYVAIQNTLIGKSGNDTYSIPLHKISKLVIE
jgi:hypothetical protein